MSAFRLALANLRSHPWRTLVSMLGVSGAVVLVFMQLGFLGSLQRTATLLYDRLDFDLLLVSEDYLELSRPHELVRARLAQVQALPEIQSILPISMGVGVWRDPRRPEKYFGRSWIISILGVPPAELYRLFRRDGAPVFASPAELAEAQANLARLDTVLIDGLSRPEFGGTPELKPGASQDLRLNGKRIEIVGEFQVGTGFSYNGLLIASEETFARYTGRSPEHVTFGLIKLAPGFSTAQVRDRLAKVLPGDVRLLTRDELSRQETRFWVEETSVGLFFRVGVWIALLVGGIFVSQVMSSDILKQLPEYATVKALGYRPSYLWAVVLYQALLLSLSGYLPGLVLALGCYELTWQVARLPIQMTCDRAGLVLLLSIAMCLVAGLVAMLKLNQADPADLFQ